LIRGIDISDSMVNVYNTQVENQGLSTSFMHAIRGDLLSDPPTESATSPDFNEFDLAAVGLGFHHFENPGEAAKRLVSRLKLGSGIFLVVDFLPHGHRHDHSASHTVAHHGFDEETITKIFAEAGCKDIKFEVLGSGLSFDMEGKKFERQAFAARGTRET
jgi:SAM-dependent methyltransferase